MSGKMKVLWRGVALTLPLQAGESRLLVPGENHNNVL